MASIATLILNDKLYEPEKCTFGIQIETQRYSKNNDAFLYGLEYLTVNYWIDIRVDENSGEDGAPAPEATDIPIQRVTNNRIIFPTELAGIIVDDKNDWNSWYGNDAPELTNNRMEFKEYKNNIITLDWTAHYGWQTQKQFHFFGPMVFNNIKMRVKSEQHSDIFFRSIFGDEYVNKVTKHVGEWIQFGSGTSEQELRWLEIVYNIN